MRALLVSLSALAVFVIVGCKDDSQTSTASAEPLPAGLITTSEPAGAIDVTAAKSSAKDGEKVVIKGHVGGQTDPLAENRAIMTVADASLPTCDKTPGDTCKTPWDSCCEPKDEIAAKTVSVQVVGADGKPLQAGLKGVGGLAPLKHVVVAGIARHAPGSDVLLVEANQIYVAP
jgi:hypothetical protein